MNHIISYGNVFQTVKKEERKIIRTEKSNALQKALFRKYGDEFDLDRFHAWIMDNYDIHCTLTEISDWLSISITTFQNDFKEIHGQSFHSFMHQHVVIRKAALLLEDPSLSILDIAMEIGYQSPSKFSTAFYNVYGVTPMQYRVANLKRECNELSTEK